MVGSVNATTTGGGTSASFATRIQNANQMPQQTGSQDAALMLALMGMGRQPLLATTTNGAKADDKAVAKATKDPKDTKPSDKDEPKGKGKGSSGGGCPGGCCGGNCTPEWTGNSQAVEPAASEKSISSEPAQVELASAGESVTKERDES